MIVNAKIAGTYLTGQGGIVAIVAKINGQSATSEVPVKIEDVGKFLAIAEVPCWENLNGAPIRIEFEQEGDSFVLKNVLNYIEDEIKIEAPQGEPEPEDTPVCGEA